MKVIYKRCAGLDVHKKTVVACRINIDDDLEHHLEETRTFKTMTNDILIMADWLKRVVSHMLLWKVQEPIGSRSSTSLKVNSR